MEENNKSIIFLKIIKVVICAFLFFEFCKIIILPNVFFSSSEINYSRGTILVALKELQILKIMILVMLLLLELEQVCYSLKILLEDRLFGYLQF